MTCPFRDDAHGSPCIVLRIEGDVQQVCAAARSGDDQGKGYRSCSHYITAICGGLETVLRRARAERNKEGPS